jgi:pyocin large subunit-like protein
MSSPIRGSGQRLEALVAAMQGTTLTGSQRMVIVTLSGYADHRTGMGARAGHRALAREAGVEKDTVGRALHLAEEFGLIVATSRRKGCPTVYTVLPDLSASAGHPAEEVSALAGRSRGAGVGAVSASAVHHRPANAHKPLRTETTETAESSLSVSVDAVW